MRKAATTAGSLVACFAVIGLIEFTVPYSGGWRLIADAVLGYDHENFQHLIVHLSYLPRISVALLVGGMMGLAGCVMQLVLRNPIAAPTTLGISAGAEFGMIVGLLLMPLSFSLYPALSAFLGAAAATGLVLALSARSGFAPVQMILAGMVVSLFLGSVSVVLLSLNEYELQSVFVWGTGVLNQNGWDSFQLMATVTVVPAMALLLFHKPIEVMTLGDDVAQAIGLRTSLVRLVVLSLGIVLTAAVVSEVGLIGFIGVVAPAIARLTGIRGVRSLMILSAVIGALLLLFADLIVQIAAGADSEEMPTGAMTALAGAPFLLWMLLRQRWQTELRAQHESHVAYQKRSFLALFVWLLISITAASIIAMFFGQSAEGWGFNFDREILELRLPRLLAAIFAGAGLAVAGTVLQRMTQNPMASPEVLGISSGVAFAIVLGTISGAVASQSTKLLWGISGAVLTTSLLLFVSRRKHANPAQLLLTGIAISAALSAAIKIALASGGETAINLVNWLAGSLYLVSMSDVYWLGAGVTILTLFSLTAHRQLDLIYTGDDIASSLGVNLRHLRAGLLLGVGALTTLCMLVIGPLSFVGLIAPHMARFLNQYSALSQLVTASLLGSIIMVCADWLSRTVWFPQQFPAGLLASVLGGAYFILMLRSAR